MEIKGNCHDLKVEIIDEFDERTLDSKEFCMKFKEVFNKEMEDPATMTIESFSKLSRLQVYLSSFKTKANRGSDTLNTFEATLTKVRIKIQIIVTPGIKEILAIITKYRDYKSRMNT